MQSRVQEEYFICESCLMSSQIVSSDPVEVVLHSSPRSPNSPALCTLNIYANSPTTAQGHNGRLSEVRVWCTRLGMLPNVVEDWATWRANPASAMIWFFSAQCAFPHKKLYHRCVRHGRVPAKGYRCPECCRILNFAVSIVLFLGAPITRYLYTVPYMVALPLHLADTIAFWRWGPMISSSKLFRMTLPIGVLGFLSPLIVGFAGPVQHTPFGNQLIFTAVLAIWFFTR
jgi:hypothetical protein